MRSSYTARISALASRYSTSCTIVTSLSRAGSLQLVAEPSGQKHADHTKIADQRPDWMPKGLWPIVLEFEMAEPRQSVAGRGRGEQPAPIALDPGGSDRGDCQCGAEVAQPPGARARMCREIALPNLRVSHARLSL